MGSRGNSSGVAISITGVTNTTPAFLKWAKQRLSSYLPGPSIPVQQVQNGGGITEAHLMSLTNSISNLASTKQATAAEAARKKEEGRMLSEYDIAALKGFSGVDDPGHCTVFWPLLKTSKSIEDARANLMRGMQQWAEATGNEIYDNVFYSEEPIKDIMKMNPNPGKLASLSNSERGVSNMGNIPKTPKEIEERLNKERAANAAAGNRSYKEQLALLSSTPKKPPENYYSLKLNVATTCAQVFVLYGRQCDLYINLMGLLDVLKGPDCKNNVAAFTPLFCRQVSWAIYMDCRSFFSQKKMPQDFLRAQVQYAKSLLKDVYSNVLWQNPVLRSTFPTSWDAAAPKEEKPPTTPARPAKAPAPTQPTNQHPPTRQGGGGGGGGNGYQNPTDWSHLHPRLQEEIGPLLRKFDGRVSIQEIMQNANIWWGDLPKVEKFVNQVTGSSELCWNHVVGTCKFGSRCLFAASHVNGSQLPAEFVEQVAALFKPGLAKMLSNDYDRRSYQLGKYGNGGPPSKRARR